MFRSFVVLCLACLVSTAHAQPTLIIIAHASGLVALPAAPKPLLSKPNTRVAYLSILRREAASAGLPVEIADAVVQIESGYNPSAIGKVGEVGLMQVRQTTAAMLGFEGSTAELAQPEVNLHYGVRYLAEAWRLSNGDLCRALMKYRAGHGSETMSALSVAYCARAHAVLKMPEIPGVAPLPARSAPRSELASVSQTPLPKGLKRGTPEFHRVFWAAHEARITKLKVQVHAIWSVRSRNPK